ncbi:MAG: hypothetical protein ACP5N1_03270 [Candidatus Woesearchaeota archaeon]
MKEINELDLEKLIKTNFDGIILIDTDLSLHFKCNSYQQELDTLHQFENSSLIELKQHKLYITSESSELLRIVDNEKNIISYKKSIYVRKTDFIIEEYFDDHKCKRYYGIRIFLSNDKKSYLNFNHKNIFY